MQPRDLFSLVGTTISDKFRVEKILGEGGYGVVYGGTHLLLGQPVAIKCLKPVGFTPEERERAAQAFLREARILFNLTHPAVVRLYDVGILPERQVPYAVLELLTGTTLADELMARAKLDRVVEREEIGAIFGPILEGVAFAHEKGIVHRDLKPGNIMLVHEGSRWQPKVLDFGTARDEKHDPYASSLASSASLAAPTGFTPLYAAPEQWDRSLGTTSAATDVFALGISLAETCLLRYPFETTSGLLSVFKNALDERSRPLIVESRPDLPVELERVILRALRVKASERYPDAREMLASFRAALRITTTTAPLAKPLAAPPTLQPNARQSDPGMTMPITSPRTSSPSGVGTRPSQPQPVPLVATHPSANAQTPPPITQVGGTTTQPHALLVGAATQPPAQPSRALPWVIGCGGLVVTVVVLIAGASILAYRAAKPAARPVMYEPDAAPVAQPVALDGGAGASDHAPSTPVALGDAGAHGPRIIVGGVNGPGPFWTPGEVLEVAHQHHAELIGCANEASVIDPTLQGPIYVTVSPTKTGLVESVQCSMPDGAGSARRKKSSAAHDSSGEDAVCGCIERVVGKWHYPPAHGRLGLLEAGPFIYTMRLTQPRRADLPY